MSYIRVCDSCGDKHPIGGEKASIYCGNCNTAEKRKALREANQKIKEELQVKNMAKYFKSATSGVSPYAFLPNE